MGIMVVIELQVEAVEEELNIIGRGVHLVQVLLLLERVEMAVVMVDYQLTNQTFMPLQILVVEEEVLMEDHTTIILAEVYSVIPTEVVDTVDLELFI